MIKNASSKEFPNTVKYPNEASEFAILKSSHATIQLTFYFLLLKTGIPSPSVKLTLIWSIIL